MDVRDKLGKFAKLAGAFAVKDVNGNPLSAVEYGVSVVHGPFRLVTKDQIAIVTGVVTESMLNAVRKKDQVPVYEFQGNGWKPQALVGDILLQDTDNPNDRWACGTSLFGGTGWVGSVTDSRVTYAKPGKPLLALELPNSTVVKSREGSREAPAGSLLAVTNVEEGDFYLWTPDVVSKYVRDFAD